jgi:hypothetical protein
MAEPALQYDEFEDIEPIEIPAGGIATFLTAKEGMFADDDDIPQGGIAQVKAVADQLAEFGRHEDEYMVHAAHGETVIPMEVFRKNPILKENIYKQMRDMGLEPERYVVGSEFNSINPVTGQPEFFLKKLFKGIKKVFKVVAPIVATIALTPFVGPIAANAITAGITTLATGGSLKDSLKMAAIGGITGGIGKAIQGAAGAASQGGNIFTGAKEGFMAARGTSPFVAGKFAGLTSQPIASAGPPLDFTVSPEGELVKDVVGVEDVVANQLTPGPGGGGGDIAREIIEKSAQTPTPTQTSTLPAGGGVMQLDAAGQPQGLEASIQPTADRTFQAPSLRSGINKLIPGLQEGETGQVGFRPLSGLKDIFLPQQSLSARAREYGQNVLNLSGASLEEYVKNSTSGALTGLSGFARKYGPGIGAIMAVDALSREEPEDFNVAEEVENPLIGDRRYSPGTFLPRPTYTIKTLKPEDFAVPTTAPVYKPVPGVAEGGGIDENIFPRMMGPIEGPGTETSDDIPAMLSDGEFVMTAKAVRGAGNGSRQRGMRNMYNMMSNFEAMA